MNLIEVEVIELKKDPEKIVVEVMSVGPKIVAL